MGWMMDSYHKHLLIKYVNSHNNEQYTVVVMTHNYPIVRGSVV